jgi:hypothetical protein
VNTLAIILSLLGVGAPAPSNSSIGPWAHFIWVLVIVALIIFVVWWGWSRICGRIPEPLRTVLVVLGIIALVLVIVFYILLPLMAVF